MNTDQEVTMPQKKQGARTLKLKTGGKKKKKKTKKKKKAQKKKKKKGKKKKKKKDHELNIENVQFTVRQVWSVINN